ncbi:uncharacterized protein LOC111109719 [Crassostrea virginica]
MAIAYASAVLVLFVLSIMLFVDCKFPNRYYRKGTGRWRRKHDKGKWEIRTTSTPDIDLPSLNPDYDDYEYDHKTGCNCDSVNQLITRLPWTPVYPTKFSTPSSHPWPPPKTTTTTTTTTTTITTTTVPTTTTTTNKRSTLPSAIKSTVISTEIVKPDCKPLTKQVEAVYAPAWTSILGAGFGGLALGVILTALFCYCRNRSANKQNSPKAEKIELQTDKQHTQHKSTSCDQESYYYTLDAEEGFKHVYENDP